jgi:hypothetical protein
MALTQNEKFEKAIKNLKLNTEMIWAGSITTEEEFNKIKWVTGEDSNRIAITTKTNPHSELTWIKVNNKMIELNTAYDALDYQRKRKAEYPSIEELIVALYDTEDKLTIENKRKAIKEKYPK